MFSPLLNLRLNVENEDLILEFDTAIFTAINGTLETPYGDKIYSYKQDENVKIRKNAIHEFSQYIDVSISKNVYIVNEK